MTAVSAALSMCVGSLLGSLLVIAFAVNLAGTARRWWQGMRL